MNLYLIFIFFFQKYMKNLHSTVFSKRPLATYFSSFSPFLRWVFLDESHNGYFYGCIIKIIDAGVKTSPSRRLGCRRVRLPRTVKIFLSGFWATVGGG